ncbi:hypothetical protein BEH94_01330 [Candidatus Altiarchaeales archaeon WOR_SM1_SCG]|nr:hypothetical protein BEH94_01330 [Candidatus Altiarchaeales archaeon WOR_SM1_SCG]
MTEIGIVVEGESDKKIVSEILRKLDIKAHIFLPLRNRGGKSNMYEYLRKIVFGKLRNYRKRIVLVDYDDSKKWENKFDSKIRDLKKKPDVKNKKIILHFAKQEIEAWLLGCYPGDILKDVKTRDPDEVIKPHILIENFEKKKRKNKNFHYNKTVDGPKIAKRNELKHFRTSKSFRKFEEILQNN